DVLLRGAALSGQALALGGVAFVLIVLRGAAADDDRPLAARALHLTALGAGVLAAAQTLSVALELSALVDDGPWPRSAALGTLYSRAGAGRRAAWVGLAAAAPPLARAPHGGRGRSLAAPAVTIAVTAALMSHGVAQVHGRWPLVGLTALHQIAAGV